MAARFATCFNKTAGVMDAVKSGVKKIDKQKAYKALEYGGLGTLAAIDLNEARKAHKEGDKSGRNKALVGAGALGALMGATRLAGH